MLVTTAAYREWDTARQSLTEEAWRRGYRWLTCLLDTCPQAHLEDVAWDLGFDAIHVWLLLWEEAAHTGTLERCGRDLLVRELCHHLRRYEVCDRDSRTRLANAFDSWKRALPWNHQHREEGIRTAIVQPELPARWFPQNCRDAVVVEAFARYWPKEDPRRRYRVAVSDGRIAIEPESDRPRGDTLIVYPHPLHGCEDLPNGSTSSRVQGQRSSAPSNAQPLDGAEASSSDSLKSWGN